MPAPVQFAQARALLAHLADTATTIEAGLGYEGLLLQLDHLATPGELPPLERADVRTRSAAYHAARDHLAALDDEQAFAAALLRAELDAAWRRERAE